MKNEEQIQYLANIYALVKADGAVDKLEEKLFEKVARGIGAGYFDMRKAMERSDEDDFQIEYPNRWSDRIRSIEDMLLIAYSDERLHPLEKRVLSEYSTHLDISQEQLNVIMKETKARIKTFLEK